MGEKITIISQNKLTIDGDVHGDIHGRQVVIGEEGSVVGTVNAEAIEVRGGIKGAIGIAEDKAEASVACRQVGALAFNGKVPRQEEVFSERASILFKHVRVVRMVDPKRNALVYLVYSDRLIEGSPQNSVTAVPVPANLPIPLK